MGYDLGTASGSIEINYKGDGVAKASADFDKVGKKAGDASGTADKLGSGFLGAGAVIAAGLGVAAKSAADFEYKLSAVKAVSGASQQEMDALRKKALQLGAETSFSAGEAAQAIEELVKAGVSVPDIMNGAADATVALAAAGELELPKAAEIASNALNQFKLRAQDLPKVADTLAGAANASAISVEDLGESFNYVGPVARALGVTLEDTATAIAILGNSGIKGSAAGTALRSVLNNLSPSTKKAKDAFKELGLITKDNTNLFYDSKGQLKPLADVMQILNDKTKGLNAQQRATFNKTAFGLEAMSAATILGGQTADSFNKMSGSIAKIKSADVAKARLDNLKGSIDGMLGSLETAAIQIGTILLPSLKKMVAGITSAINAFSALPEGTQKTILAVAAAASGFLLFAGAAIKIGLAIGRLVAGAKVLGTALTGLKVIGPILAGLGTVLTGPFGIAAAIIAALGAAFFLAYKKIEPFRNAVNGAATTIKSLFFAALNAVVPLLKQAGAALLQFGTYLAATLGPPLAAAGALLKTALIDGFNRVKEAVVTALLPALAQLQPVLAQLGPILSVIGLAVQKVAGFILGSLLQGFIALATFLLGTVLPVLIRIVAFFLGNFITSLTAIIAVLVQVVAAFVSFAASVIATVLAAMTTIRNTIAAAIAFIRTLWAAFWGGPFGQLIIAAMDLVKAVIGLAMRIIRSVISGAMDFISGVVRGAMGTIKSLVSSAFSAVRNATSAAWNGVKALINGVLNAILGKVGSSTSDVKAKVAAAWAVVKAKTSEVWNGLKSTVSNAIGAVVSLANGIKGKVIGALAGAGSWLYSAGRAIIQGLINGIVSLIGSVTAKLRDLTNKIKEAKGPPEKDKILLTPAGEQIMESLMKGFGNREEDVLSMLRGFTRRIPEAALGAGGGRSAGTVGSTSTVTHGPTVNVDVNAPDNTDPWEVGEMTAQRVLAKIGG